MKLRNLLLLISLVFVAACATKSGIPTPKYAIGFNPNQDKMEKWGIGYLNGNAKGFLCEMVPEGQSVNDWKEIITNAVEFTGLGARQDSLVDAWKRSLQVGDPKVTFEDTTLPDGTVLVRYSAPGGNEYGVYHFFMMDDGFYRIGYATRKSSNMDDRLALWRKILMEATVTPNPILNVK